MVTIKKLEAPKVPVFEPVQITLNTAEEVVAFWNLINYCGDGYFARGTTSIEYGQTLGDFHRVRKQMWSQFKLATGGATFLSADKKTYST